MPRERLAIEYTRAAMADSNADPGALDAASCTSSSAIPSSSSSTFLIGYINMLNLFNNCLGVRYNGEYAILAPAVR